MSWTEFPLFAKALLGLLAIFCVANFVYFVSGDSPYSQRDMIALVVIFVVGSAIILSAGFVFRLFNKS
ncbi:hypothetical protein [Pelagerythrobacter rhizovicinus]|uniref:Uncharacterized protein n=1 Tax=Pelagerythrobacter rhizovicinus TaxID=2268576 RepID=A0A4Q2KSB7_9SPHN|nr:hypothetical protein [Pelagerythrobacter rhizovicinus]RXZ66602.1 hypothetical protein ETX26_08025 [Pelagerythrobacter rhizovicinus]